MVIKLWRYLGGLLIGIYSFTLNNLPTVNDCIKKSESLNSAFISSQDTDSLIPDSFTSDISPLHSAASTDAAVDAIIDVLKYSQKDMDAAVELVKREVW